MSKTKTNLHYVYFVTITYRSTRTQSRLKQVAFNAASAVANAMKRLDDRRDVVTINVSEGVPKSKYERQKQLNYKRAAKERHLAKRKEWVSTYDGLEKID